MHHKIRTKLKRTTQVRTTKVRKTYLWIDYGQDKFF